MLCKILCFLPYLWFGSATRTVCTWIAEKCQQGSGAKLCKLLAHLWALVCLIGSKAITVQALFAFVWVKTKFTVQNVWWLDFHTENWTGLFIFLSDISREAEYVWKCPHRCGFVNLTLHQYTNEYGQFNHNYLFLRKKQAKNANISISKWLCKTWVWYILLEKFLVVLKITQYCADCAHPWNKGRRNQTNT